MNGRPAIVAATLLALTAAPATAFAEEEVKDTPEDGFAREEAADLRDGHLLLAASGGVFAPSAPFTPAIPELGSLDVGGTAHLHIGYGLGRYLVPTLDVGFARLPALDTECGSCAATTIDAGLSLAFHLTQGFAFDPWISYGVAYRHTLLSLETTESDSQSGLDFMRLAIGADYYPVPVFGFGPYIETDVAFRGFSDPVFFAIFHAGLRVTFDPFRGGTSFAPGVASR